MSINYKFILIGNSGVGKTSFFRKLSTGDFYDKNISTIGIEKKTFNLDINIDNNGKSEKKQFEIYLFDTAGQEKFRAITFNYFKGTDGILLIYDIADKSTFESVENWISSIREAIGNNSNESKYATILIGNKLDLIEEQLKERAVTEEEASEICKKYDIVWGGEKSIRSISFEELNKLFEDYVIDIYKRVGEKKSVKQTTKKLSKGKSSTRSGACTRCIAGN